jgi:tetratricopeptide (TPR) repeat protein
MIIADNLLKKGQINFAKDYYEKALNISKEHNIQYYEYLSYYKLANVHFLLKNYEQSLNFIQTYLDYSTKTKNFLEIEKSSKFLEIIQNNIQKE